MNFTALEKRRSAVRPGRVVSAAGLSLLLFLGQTAPIFANPAGGTVVAGAATIGAAGQTLTINQTTGSAIINWQQFSIANGETTKFVVPNAFSATLNRVTGGNPSQIYGNLQSNGVLFLVNPNGIVVGPNGRIDTAGFMASTLDISNQQFLAGGNLNLSGNSSASIDNEGTIHASTGDVYLIASQVNNKGTITAPQGNVGLAAGTDILFQQAGSQHLFVQPTPAGTKRATGVTNSGTISAATAELRAAGGNAYALAINNTGSIAATGYKKVNGQVYLTSDGGSISNSGKISARTASGNGGTIVVDGSSTSGSGTVTNSGVLDASATAAGGTGGSITLKNMGGTTVHSGSVLANGGLGGAGGTLDISGTKVSFTGTVDLTAPGGKTGMLIIDPATFTVEPSGGDETGAALSTALATANVTLNADTAVFINDNVTWTSSNTLTVSTNLAQSSIVIGGNISGVNGTLTISGFNDSVVVGDVGAVDVANFILAHGTWGQSGTLPTFIASHDFEIQSSSTFIRAAGGDGSAGSPLQIADIYGLQGLASPSGELLNLNFELVDNINASSTATWNSGSGFVPIGTNSFRYNGTFNGQGYTIDGLTIDLPSTNGVGLFAFTSASTTIENVGLTNAHITGSVNVGALVGNNVGAIINTFSTGTIAGGSGTDALGGLVGANNGTINSSSSTASVTATSGVNYGGLAGFNTGTISNAFSTGAVNVSGGNGEGGLVGYNDGGTINNSYSTGAVSGTYNVGALVGYNGGTINNSFWDTTTSGITSPTGGVGNGTNSGVTGATTSQLESQTYILSNSPVSPTWNFTSVWTTNGGTTTPQLIGQPTGTPTTPTMGTLAGVAYTDNGSTVSSDTTVDLIFDGSLLGSTTTDNLGNYSFSITIGDLTSGLLVTDASVQGNTVYQLSTPSGTSFSGVDIWGNTLIVNANATGNAGLKAAVGSLSGLGINYTVNGAALATNSGINMVIEHGYQLDGNITASGSFITESGASLTGTQNVTLTGSSVRMNGTFDTTGSITVVSTAGPIDLEEIGTDAGTAYAAGLTLNSEGSVTVDSSNIQLRGGNFTATGSGDSATLDGVDITNSEIDTEGGSYNITGTAATDGNGNAGFGVVIDNSDLVTSNASVTGGNYTISGTSALGTNFTTEDDLDGVYITHSVLGLVNGTLSITGTVSDGTTSGSANGILVDNASAIHATGTGSLSLTGNTTGTTSSNGNYGVRVTGGSIIGATNASGGSVSGIKIMGTAGNMANEAVVATDAGISIEGGGLLIASGTAPITLIGTGGTETNTDFEDDTGSGGVFLTSQTDGETSSISSNSGAISITGTSGASPIFSFGVNVFGYNGGIAAISSNSGHITVNGSTTTSPNSSNQLNGVVFQDAAQISSVTGDVTITGNALNGTANFDSASTAQGVYIFGGSIFTAGSGSISITGNTTGTTASSQILGVLIQNESVSSTSGNITVNGTVSTPGSVSDELVGAQISSGSTFTTGDGAISLIGTVSAGTATIKALGIDIIGASTITANGTAGGVTLTGNTAGTTASGINLGITVGEVGSTVTASGTAGLVVNGTAGNVDGAIGPIIDGTDGAAFEPLSAGIFLADGGRFVTTGTAPMTLTGTGGTNTSTLHSATGYIDPNTGTTPGSYGVAVFSATTDEMTSISSGGNLVVMGTAGSSPISGIGVAVGGPSNLGDVSIISNGSVSITGIGGAGNTTDTTSPNAGVAILDPGNNAASVTIRANGGNLVVTGTGGAGTDVVGINGAPFFNSVFNTSSFDPELFSSATIRLISLAGKIDMSGLAGGTNALATSLMTPLGTSSYAVFGSNSGTVTLNGGGFSVSEFGGGVSFGPINVTDLSITQDVLGGETPGATSLSSVTTGNLSITTVGDINLNGAIQASGPVTIQNTGGNITFGSGGSISDSGAGNKVILAAGTNLPNSHYIINHSSAGANAIQVSSGANFYLYSADPTYDSLGGIAVTPEDVVFNAIFATSGLPSANQELFYVASASDFGPNHPGGTPGNGSIQPPSTQTGGADGSGSNIVPPALTPNQPPITTVSGSTSIAGSVFQPTPVNYSGNGSSSYGGSQDNGLANSSGNSGQVGAGDAAQLGGGQLNNFSNPHASGVLNEALGTAVYISLSDALNGLGDWAESTSSPTGNDDTASNGGGDNDETILTGGDVAVIGDSGVKNIDPSKAPPQLRKAMGSDALKGMNGGAGH